MPSSLLKNVEAAHGCIGVAGKYLSPGVAQLSVLDREALGVAFRTTERYDERQPSP